MFRLNIQSQYIKVYKIQLCFPRKTSVKSPQITPTAIPSLRPRINPKDAVTIIKRFGCTQAKASDGKMVLCKRKHRIIIASVMSFRFIDHYSPFAVSEADSSSAPFVISSFVFVRTRTS